MALGAFLYPTGHHAAAWRHPSAQADAGINFAHYAAVAKLAEEAKFDLLFLADSAGARGHDWNSLSRFATHYVAQFEPLTLLAALATVTSRIGLVATASTTYNEPYTLARKFASIDHISGGRAGWNLVTSGNEEEAYNFGLDAHPPHAERYARATEFAAVVRALWDSWEDDAFPRDKASGIFLDPAKMHPPNHAGERFKVRGPLNIPRPPQGWPVLVQAGSSEAGQELAAATAEVVFTAQQTLAEAQAFYRGLKERLPRYGRHADEVKILPGIFPVVGATEAEAQAKFDELQELIHPSVGLTILEHRLGVSLSHLPIDGPLPEAVDEINASKSRQTLMLDLARREGLSIRQLALRVAGARGHWQVVGTPEQIADAMEERFREGAADGFNVMPPTLPGGLEDFARMVVPELRARGLVRADYEGATLRDHLGLARPADRAGRAQHPSAAV
ncbi:LLM class flavin-dependent oxidoreductase [Aureimonas leprariae]|uniref:LLM class flavin-dependent oxidoreductase n=2 Tax=Plantimonas leprariae TaxID=2615207 RepID=A0A7V7PM01_9HYPH|nr:LLM class flavin-dependent oxidoreductase [Aureimonas leprariae]